MSEKRGTVVNTILLLALAIAVVAGAFLYRGQAKEIDEARQKSTKLLERSHTLSAETEKVIGEMANLRIRRNDLAEKLAKIERKHQAAIERIATLEEDLKSVRAERDEHLSKRLELSRRLEDALLEISKK